jgi:FkbH-like protein
MEPSPPDLAPLEAYVQADGEARLGLFDGFVRALKALAAAAGDAAAARWARRAVSPALDYSSLMKLRRFVRAAAPADGAPGALRLAVLGGPTTTQLAALLETFLAAEDIACVVYEGDYGLFRQEILTPGSGLDRFRPQIVFIAAEARDVSSRPPLTASAEEAAAAAAAEADRWLSLWETAHRRWNCSVVSNTFVAEPWGELGHYAARHPASREFFLQELNLALGRRAPAYAALHDLRALVLEAGAARWYDPRFYLEAKMPCAPECLVAYAHSVMSLVRALRGRSRKVLALDLDDTLWGGCVGEAGPGGIVLGQGSAEGEAFLDFQRCAKSLRDRGILLAAVSKNDEAKALEPFERRQDMILKRSDFACFLANWNNKADNLRAVAARLNLGLDSIVFVDDNPIERALVRRLLPEVAVPDMPLDPSGRVRALAAHRYFETASLTAEDVKRADDYAQQARRADLAARSADLDSFLASLDMRATVEPVSDLNVERVAQLVNKSNQFNLTTRRRTAGEILALGADPDWDAFAVGLCDALGDSGLISVVFARRRGEELDVDTWLMSCRVLQRGVEEFVLNELVARARGRGCRLLRGAYAPTAKNGLVRDLYSRLGFRAAGEENGAALWELTIDGSLAPAPTRIRKGDDHG